MSRSRFRSPALAAGSLALSLLAATQSSGQGVDLKPYRIEAKEPAGDTESKLNQMRDNRLFVTGPELKVNQKLFQEAAQASVYRLTYEQYYTSPDNGDFRPRKSDSSVDYLISDTVMPRLLIPTAETKFTLEQKAYINEFGAALDAALVAVLTKGGMPPAVIQVNAGRMLAAVARSGAPAHAKTVTELLTNTFYKVGGKPTETPPALLFWALKAAESLIAAYDPVAHLTTTPAKHSLSDQQLEALIRAIEPMIVTGPPVLDKAAEATVDQPPKAGTVAPATPPAAPAAVQGKLDARVYTPEQVALVRYFRRQAVRALAKVRFDTVRDARPAYTVAKVAAADLSIDPPPSAAEVGEAVIGLAALQPTATLNVDEWLYVLGLGFDTLIRVRAGVDDKTIPWRVYAARLQAGLDTLKRTAASNPRARSFQSAITALTGVLSADVLSPLSLPPDRAGEAQPKTDGLYQWMGANIPKDPTRSLYNDNAQYKLNPRAAQR